RKIHMIFPYADEIVVSPDGKHVAFQEGDNIYLTTFPKLGTGNKPVFIDKKNGILPVTQISHIGGLFPKWWDESTLEFGSGNSYYSYSIDDEKKDSTEVNFKVAKDLPEGTIAIKGAQ